MDIINWLEKEDIEYWEEGKNISSGWIGIQCPFCDDSSNHLGISPDRLKFSCWKCGETGGLSKLIKELTRCGWRSAYRLAEEIGQDALGEGYESSSSLAASTQDRPEQGILPSSSSSTFPKTHRRYLKRRRFSLKRIKKDYGILAQKLRIVIPYYLDGRIVTYTARDITDKADKKYLACPNRKAIIPIKSTFYNIDRATDKVVLVEGVTDVWRIGKGSIAASGVIITNEQLLLLSERRIKKVFIVFDEDASGKADRYANKLSAVTEVEIIELEKGDPAEQSPEVVSQIRRLLL